EAERLQYGGEKQVVLVAIAAAALVHELALQGIEVERQRPVEQRVEVLERDAGGVALVDEAQRVERGCAGSTVADASEIGVQVQLAGAGPARCLDLLRCPHFRYLH